MPLITCPLSLALGLLLVTCHLIHAAEITATKMAILNTDQGKVTEFEDGVVITDGGTKITAGKVDFYDQLNTAWIFGGVTITTPNSTVTADSARYLLGARQTYLDGHVVIQQEGLRVTSPSLVLDNGRDHVTTTSEIHIWDEKQGFEVAGIGGDYDLKTLEGFDRRFAPGFSQSFRLDDRDQ